MILGLSSLVVAGLVLGPLAIIYAIRGGTTNPMSMTGLISGIIGTILGAFVGIIFMIMWTIAAEMS